MAVTGKSHLTSEYLRLLVLGFGLQHRYRVVQIDDVADDLPHVERSDIAAMLDSLAAEGLVTRLTGRYCFNRTIPRDLQEKVENTITASGTIRARH